MSDRWTQPLCRTCHNRSPAGGSASNLIYVTVQSNESIDSALKRFNMKLQQSGVLRELKEHAHYEKPSEKRRRLKRRRASRQ
jgi:small subunit ribosomal protein S21